MTRYVVGFIFSKDKNQVLLIRKDRPHWQVGKFNGVGGKVEEKETIIEAMKRECFEESGLTLDNWLCKGTIVGKDYLVSIFITETSLDNLLLAQNYVKKDEPCKVFNLDELDQIQTISQLKWLIPMVLDKDLLDITITQKDK